MGREQNIYKNITIACMNIQRMHLTNKKGWPLSISPLLARSPCRCNNAVLLFQLYNFENEELDQSEDQEIIYYPPSEGDGSDSMRYGIQLM